ncbi:zeta toxin family protein [Variovorax paradoxus]|uniref:zeta toxin family protein n=1 Tax=Variovorax paradoxus TaxID=34073 RepID=UPI002786979D|nr:zeta toxin family protein [Variovorax paradoxus]MDP9930625.1 hypothetical protein [Variovorax paradoxus]
MAGSNPYRLSEVENERIFREEILPEKIKNIGSNLHPVEHPTMVIIGGQPGAGKSRTMGGVERELTHQGGALKISPDDFREYHPAFEKLNIANDRTSSSFTHEDAGIWAEKLEKYGREHKLNVILEGTLRTPENAAARLQEYKAAGYTTDVRVVATNERTSWQSVHSRYESDKKKDDYGRWVPKDGHDSAYKGVLDSVERIEARKLSDRVGIYDRNGKAIYQNELKNGQWEHGPAGRPALEGERSKPLTPEQWDTHLRDFDKITRNVIRPGRSASAEDIQEVQRLRARSEAAATEQLGHAPPKSIGTRLAQLGAADASIGTKPGFQTLVKGGGVASVALLGYDALTTASQYNALTAQGNQFGADALLHEYVGRTGGGLAAGFAAGAAYGAATGSFTGPGALVTGAVGGTIGAFGGEAIGRAYTKYQMNHQVGDDGNTYAHTHGHWEQSNWVHKNQPAAPDQINTLEYKRTSAITELALARPQHLDPQNITLQDPQGQKSDYRLTKDGWVTEVTDQGPYGTAIPVGDFGAVLTHDERAAPDLSKQLDQISAVRRDANAYYSENLAKAYMTDYVGRGFARDDRPVPESVTQLLRLPSEIHVKDPATGQTWERSPQGAFTRTDHVEMSGLEGKDYIPRTLTAKGEELARLDKEHQGHVQTNRQYGAALVEQKFQDMQRQELKHQQPPQKTTPPGQQQPTSGHLTPQQIERITTHESRIVPTPGGMSFAEAHRRRDEPEQISAGSLRPVGKLDTSQMDKGSQLYRMHLAQEQARMRDLEIALAQDRERFKNEPKLPQPSVERTQERVQERTQERAQDHSPRRLLEEAPVAQAHVSPARPAAGAEAMHSPTTHASTHASVAAPVHSNPPGDAATIAAAQAQVAAAQAQAAAAQAQAVAAQAKLAQMHQQMARMAAERGHDGLARRDERDERDQRDQPGTTQIAQGRDTRQDLEAGTHGKQISATAVADTSRPLLREFSDPSHPQNALYNTLKDGLPQRTAPELLSHLTAACYKSGIKQPDDLAHVVGREGKLHFLSRSLFGPGTTVDVTQPAPSVQQTMQEVQQFDQQRATDRAQYQAQAAAQANQQQGPMLG